MNNFLFILYMAHKNFHTKPCVFTITVPVEGKFEPTDIIIMLCW